MIAISYLGLVALLAYHLQTRVRLLDGFTGVFRYLFSLGLTLFLVNWLNFLIYVSFGWGWVYLVVGWAALLIPLLGFSIMGWPRFSALENRSWRARAARLWGSPWNWWCLFLFFFVLIRTYSGLDSDDDDFFWSTFNFDDTPFHLSVTNALLNAHRFPPMDLDMAPYPLKYHFLADFWLAHLERLGTRAIYTILGMNCLNATILVGALWAVFQKWLRLPPKWIMLACLIFLFLNTSLVNLIHFFWFRPHYFNPESAFDGLLAFPYFNFESSLANMFNPQRGLAFTFPIGLLVLDAVFGTAGNPAPAPGSEAGGMRSLQALVLVCLLPFAHIVTFAIVSCGLAPRLWEHRRWLLPHVRVWLPAMALGALQLLYLTSYGPSVHPDYFSSDVAGGLPLEEFAAVPAVLRRALFWFFIDGDFLVWGGLFAAAAILRRSRPGSLPSPLSLFLRRWWWYFAVCALFFLGINFYRYTFDWGDSNKFVLFLNFGLTMVIVLGAAGLRGRFGRMSSRALWLFFFALCLAPPTYRFAAAALDDSHGSVLLFHRNDRAAAKWLRTLTRPSDIVLTGAYGSIHFVSSLGGRPVLAGLYGRANPYRQDERAEDIRHIYEDGDLGLLRKLHPRYVCVSRYERNRYQLNSCWQKFRKLPGALVFQAGTTGDLNAVYIFDSRRLLEPDSTAPTPIIKPGSKGYPLPRTPVIGPDVS